MVLGIHTDTPFCHTVRSEYLLPEPKMQLEVQEFASRCLLEPNHHSHWWHIPRNHYHGRNQCARTYQWPRWDQFELLVVGRVHRWLLNRDHKHLPLLLHQEQHAAWARLEQKEVRLHLRGAEIQSLGTLDFTVSNCILAETATDRLRDDLLEALDGPSSFIACLEQHLYHCPSRFCKTVEQIIWSHYRRVCRDPCTRPSLLHHRSTLGPR